MTTMTDAPLREACRRAASRTLLADLAAIRRRDTGGARADQAPADRPPAAADRAIVFELLLGLTPTGRRITPFPAAMILDELDRRMAEESARS